MAWYAAIPLAIFHTVFGVLTVKVFAFLETGFDRATLGNMSLFGGVFFMPVAYWLGAKLFKRPMKETFDVFTPCMIFTVMCARINCILAGCCTGLIIPGTQFRYPTRELELIYYVVMLILLIPRVKKDENPGTCYPLYMASYGAFRLLPNMAMPVHAASKGTVTGLADENIGLSFSGDADNAWSASGTQIVGSATGTGGACSDTHYNSTLTITNKRSTKATLSFDYTIALSSGSSSSIHARVKAA